MQPLAEAPPLPLFAYGTLADPVFAGRLLERRLTAEPVVLLEHARGELPPGATATDGADDGADDGTDDGDDGDPTSTGDDSDDGAAFEPAPAVLPRLTAAQYRNSLESLLGTPLPPVEVEFD